MKSLKYTHLYACHYSTLHEWKKNHPPPYYSTAYSIHKCMHVNLQAAVCYIYYTIVTYPELWNQWKSPGQVVGAQDQQTTNSGLSVHSGVTLALVEVHITHLIAWSCIYNILVFNVTAACVRGCAASVGLLVTGKEKKRGRAKRGQQTVNIPSWWGYRGL